MSRNKALLALLLCFCLLPSSCLAESDSLISEDMIREETVNYETIVAEPGLYERVRTSSVSLYYPYTYKLRCEVSGAKFGEYLVSANDEVKAGEPLATFILDTDEVGLASKRKSLENARADLEKQREDRSEDMEKLLEQLRETEDSYERELLSLKIQRAEVSMEQYLYQQQSLIENLEEEIAEIEEEMNSNQLISPIDGVVKDVNFKREGDRVSVGEVLITVYSEDVFLLCIDNETGDFRYGARVTVEVGNSNDRRAVTGQIVGADTLLPDARRNKLAYIKLDPYEDDGKRHTRPTASTSDYYLENVMILPRKALTFEGGKYYVNKLVDGAVQKRFVNFVMQNIEYAWVIQGVEAGDKIIID